MAVRTSQRDVPWSPFATVYDPIKVGHITGTGTTPHDHGLERALKASFKPDAGLRSDPVRTVFVGRLNPVTTEVTIERFFSKFGSIRSLILVRDVVTGSSRRYAFVEYAEQADAKRAVIKGNKQIVDDYAVLVDEERGRLMPGWIPRRLGGGFGGKKESGQLRFGCPDHPWKRPLRKRLDVSDKQSGKYS